MKFLIISIFLTTITHANELDVTWFCPTVHGGNSPVQLVPQYKKVKVSWDERGVKFDPDIFEKKPVKSFFSSLFSKSNKFRPELSTCVEKFKKQFAYQLSKSELCDEKDCADEAKNKISKELSKKDLVANPDKVPELPRFYTGHTFSNDSEETFKQSLGFFCDGYKTNPVVFTSQGFIQYVKNLIANPLVKLDPACVSDFEDYLEEHTFKGSCSGDKICKRIQKDTDIYKEKYSNLRDGNVKKATTKVSPNKSAYREATSDYKAKAAKAISELENFPSGRGCYFWKSLYSNGVEDLFYHDNAVKEVIPFLEQNGNPECIKTFLENYLIEKYRNNKPNESLHCKKRDCSDALRAERLFHQNAQRLTDALYGKDKYNLQACINTQAITKDNAATKLKALLEDIKTANTCSELKIGDSKVFDGTGFPTGGNYSIKRLDDNTLEATVAVKFVKGSHENFSPQVAEKLHAKARSCLDKVSSYFKSPSGEQLKVNIISEEENKTRYPSERPNLNKIQVMPPGFRSKVFMYEEDINCETITHEALHLFGLVDEYQEMVIKDGKKVPKYKCRSTHNMKSIMGSHWKMFPEVAAVKNTCVCEDDFCREVISSGNQKAIDLLTEDSWAILENRRDMCEYERVSKTPLSLSNTDLLPFYEVEKNNKDELVILHTDTYKSASGDYFGSIYKFTCRACQTPEECESMNKLKKRVINKAPKRNRYCPRGSKSVSSEFVPMEDSHKDEIRLLGPGAFELQSSPKSPGKSLLHPAHFAKIKNGGCQSKVKKYNKCSRFAASEDKARCEDLPDYCKDPKQWLLSEE
ncbi:MAG: hypothetical protein CME64_04130 [Halobacteriovoraceae bacterium]|nr:hypothetical protein [Halobacteriovoraceae bacterium]